jgi:mannose-6-phosphate isomerase-like protein (cupin superfamily)
MSGKGGSNGIALVGTKKKEDAMTSKIFGSIVALVLACSSAAADDIRRVVTALDANDKAIALFDSRVTLEPGATPSAKLWVTDTAPAALSFTDDSSAKSTALPPDLGTALLVVEFPPLDPAEEAKLDPNFMMKVIGERAPRRGLPVRHPLMHRTRSVDYAVVLSGEIDMMLDDSVVHVRAGDVIVQQATNHAWINRGTQPCRILFALIDSRQP